MWGLTNQDNFHDLGDFPVRMNGGAVLQSMLLFSDSKAWRRMRVV